MMLAGNWKRKAQMQLATDSNPEPRGVPEGCYEAVEEAAVMSPTPSAGAVEVEREPNVEGQEVWRYESIVDAPETKDQELKCIMWAEWSLMPPRKKQCNELTFEYKQGDDMSEKLEGIACLGKTMNPRPPSASQGSPGDALEGEQQQQRPNFRSLRCPYPKCMKQNQDWEKYTVPKHPQGDKAAKEVEKEARKHDKNRGRGEKRKILINPKEGVGEILNQYPCEAHIGTPSTCVAWLFEGQGRRALVVKLLTISCRTASSSEAERPRTELQHTFSLEVQSPGSEVALADTLAASVNTSPAFGKSPSKLPAAWADQEHEDMPDVEEFFADVMQWIEP